MERLIREAEVISTVGLGRTRIWQLEREGAFPKRIRLPGTKRIVWRESEIQEWIRRTIAEARAA